MALVARSRPAPFYEASLPCRTESEPALARPASVKWQNTRRIVPPLNSYQVYLTEFRRTDFDAELYAAKTRKLIRECAKLKSFLGHLPEIAIDERYLENLRFSRMSSADKAEKIIRDIETVIRREEARNQASIADGNRSWDQTAVTRKALEI